MKYLPEGRLSLDELASTTGISLARLKTLINFGIVDPVAPGTLAFSVTTAERLRRMVSLQRNLGVNMAGAEIIVNLVDRIERLQLELSRLVGHSHDR